jgi:hypothetical protein
MAQQALQHQALLLVLLAVAPLWALLLQEMQR